MLKKNIIAGYPIRHQIRRAKFKVLSKKLVIKYKWFTPHAVERDSWIFFFLLENSKRTFYSLQDNKLNYKNFMFFNKIHMMKVVCKKHWNQQKFKFKGCIIKRFEIPPAWGLNFVPLLEVIFAVRDYFQKIFCLFYNKTS